VGGRRQGARGEENCRLISRNLERLFAKLRSRQMSLINPDLNFSLPKLSLKKSGEAFCKIEESADVFNKPRFELLITQTISEILSRNFEVKFIFLSILFFSLFPFFSFPYFSLREPNSFPPLLRAGPAHHPFFPTEPESSLIPIGAPGHAFLVRRCFL
jgi:hypothetical protein